MRMISAAIRNLPTEEEMRRFSKPYTGPTAWHAIAKL